MREMGYCFSQSSLKNIRINQSFRLNKLIITVKYLMCWLPSLIFRLPSETSFPVLPSLKRYSPHMFFFALLVVFPLCNSTFIPFLLPSILCLKLNFVLDNRWPLSANLLLLPVFTFAHHFASPYLLCKRSQGSAFSKISYLIQPLFPRQDFVHLFIHSFSKY